MGLADRLGMPTTKLGIRRVLPTILDEEPGYREYHNTRAACHPSTKEPPKDPREAPATPANINSRPVPPPVPARDTTRTAHPRVTRPPFHLAAGYPEEAFLIYSFPRDACGAGVSPCRCPAAPSADLHLVLPHLVCVTGHNTTRTPPKIVRNMTEEKDTRE